jgi:hypothetical protein
VSNKITGWHFLVTPSFSCRLVGCCHAINHLLGNRTVKVALRNSVFFALALLSIAVVSGSAVAQSDSRGCDSVHCDSSRGVGYRFVTPTFYGYRVPAHGYGLRGCGLDYRYGAAALTRARAAANVLNATARAQHAQTDRVAMQNSVQFLATRLERKQINKQNRFGHLHARGEQVRIAKLASLPAPPQVVRGPVDPASGRVAWPMLLRSTYYAKARGPIDQVFHQRSVTGSFNPDHYLPMRDWIEQIECELKANVAYYEMADYLEAKSFLRSLVDEARVDVLPGSAPTQLAAR